MRKGFFSILLMLFIVFSVVFPAFAEAGPPWVTPGLDELTITAGDPWAYLDPSVTVVSSTGDFHDGYVEVAITTPNASDEFQLVNGGLLTVSAGAVFYNGTRIGTVDGTYNGSNGRLRINFSASAPLTNSGFETSDLSGWTVNLNNNQLQGQSWAVEPTGWSSCSASGTHDPTPTIDDGTTINDNAVVQTATRHAGAYALQMTINGTVSYGCGTSHSPSILSSAFAAQAGDSLSLWYNALPTSDESDVYGFVVNSTGGRQVLFHSTGSTGGWANVTAAINTSVCPSGNCNDLQFEFINGTFDKTGGMAVGSNLYIDDIVLTLAQPPVSVSDGMVKAVVENIQYRNTAVYPTSPRPYSMNFKDSAATGNNQANIIINIPAPTITSIAPSSGPASGGTSVVITGANLTSGTVTFGGTAATCTVNSATQITCTSPAHAGGAVDVVVTTPGGPGTSVGGFTYIPAPTITGIAPDSGPLSGGTSVVITGTGLTGGVVTFDGTPATCTVDSDTQITCTTPAHSTGSVDVVVTTPGGSKTSAKGFTYVATPTFTGIAPSSGPASGGTSVVITGTNLTGGSVTFGGTTATCAVDSATQITCTSPAHAAGAVDVVVTTPGGSATSAGAFTYIPSPTITGIAPNFGSKAGGAIVVITGTNLTGGVVTFDGTPATCTVDSDTQITCTTPAHASGAVDVVVTTPGGIAISAQGYIYRYMYYLTIYTNW